jgi:formylglycine-generating enzyme required for sulfatase activity
MRRTVALHDAAGQQATVATIVCVGALLLLAACGQEHERRAAVPSWAHVNPLQVGAAQRRGWPVALENDLGMRFVLLPPGQFLMGPRSSDDGAEEGAQHLVVLPDAFYVQVTEVTNAQYRHWRSGHHSRPDRPYKDAAINASFDSDDRPVVMVTWEDARGFCRWLTERAPGRIYGFLTEAEWEYACRAGTQGRWYFGDSEADLGRYENVWDLSGLVSAPTRGGAFRTDDGAMFTAPVASYRPNPFGLYDMLGNVSEWCLDWLGPLDKDRAVDPQGPEQGTRRSTRGGSCYASADTVRASNRFGLEPLDRNEFTGIRVAMTPDADPRPRAP